jgi:hypothetical protein
MSLLITDNIIKIKEKIKLLNQLKININNLNKKLYYCVRFIIQEYMTINYL